MGVLKKYVFKDIIRKKDKELSDYRYVSFDVPKQADIIHVSYNYSKAPTNEMLLREIDWLVCWLIDKSVCWLVSIG